MLMKYRKGALSRAQCYPGRCDFTSLSVALYTHGIMVSRLVSTMECLNKSSLELHRHSWLCPTLPRCELRTPSFAQIKHCLSLCGMLANSRCSVRLLRWSTRVECEANARRGISGFECSTVGLDTLGAEEGVCPVRAVDVCSVCDRTLREGSCRDCWRCMAPAAM